MIEVGPYSFEHSDYDAFGDVGYLRRHQGDGGVGVYDSPEGHTLFAPAGGEDAEVIGIDFHSPRHQLEQTGRVAITLPDGQSVRVAEIEKLVGA
jgi:hypothetical protein